MPDPNASGDPREETVFTFTVPEGYASAERLDVYLTQLLPNVTRSKTQAGIKGGRVAVNGRPITKPSHALAAGDTLDVRLFRAPPVEVVPQDIPLDIVYEDDHLLVVDKPAGMVVHPAYGHPDGTLVNALLFHVGGGTLAADALGEHDDDDVGLSLKTAGPQYAGDPTIRPGLVHRLDKGTSGLLVVAKNDAAHAALAAQFADRSARRRYDAVVWGVPEAEGRTETDLGRDPRDRRRITVVPEGTGKRAVTTWSLQEAFAHTALVAFKLETGRTHQIRAHARHLGHPLLNDATYGGDRLVRGPDTRKRRQFLDNLFESMNGPALHARTLGFRHPASGEEMDFEAPWPEPFAHLVERLRAVEP